MSQFRFANLEWLNAIWAVLLLAAILIGLEMRGGNLLERLVSPLMRDRLVMQPSLGRRITAVLLFCGSLCGLVLALMRPQWGSTVQVQTRVDSQIMICLDVSKSMLAEDVVPNRLERAKAEIDSLLGLMGEGQQVGLMAFAGKASVLCPLTTDFGFLRLILEEASPETVGLGGTRIGEAVNKAVDGFREAGDVNRLILLITDGEDHDSFPMDAAKAAKEKGVRVISVGFGDELGSKIEVTDPQTGARTFIKDRNGIEVISRLDGATLRDIALETEGAYIPAGTGALDLQSIYDAHIASLLRGTDDTEETVVRNEAYQWCVLAALCLLLAALSLSHPYLSEGRSVGKLTFPPARLGSEARVGPSGVTKVNRKVRDRTNNEAPLPGGICQRVQIEPTRGRTWQERPTLSRLRKVSFAVLVLTLALCLSAAPAPAQSAPDQSSVPGEVATTTDKPTAVSSTSSPREIYNQAVAFVTSDPDRAESLLNASRREAGVDGELRFRTLYNLGWVDVARADALLQPDPEQALKHLELAASRFREAIRVRPDDADSRHNLEIISRRMLELTDQLAKQNPQQIAERLDELIEQIRAQQSDLQSLVTRIDPSDSDVEKYRSEFRQLGVVQRQIISDMEKLAADARREVDAGQATGQEPTGEAAVKLAQLAAMLKYLDNSVQWMNKSRSFVRRLQGERAFVRWSAALTDAKRARDQLRNPIEVLGVLIGDASEQAALMQLVVLSQTPTTDDVGTSVTKPAWLSTEYMLESQQATRERTDELQSILAAGVEQTETPPADAQALEVDQNLIASIREALPFISKAETKFGAAATTIEAEEWQTALAHQADAILALMEAAEIFYDTRRLIEVMHQQEQNLQSELQAMDEAQGKPESDKTDGDLSGALQSQGKNLRRAERLEKMLAAELAKLAGAVSPADDGSGNGTPGNPPQDVDGQQAEKDRLVLAQQLLSAAKENMDEAQAGMQAREQNPEDALPIAPVEAAVQKLHELRRLFFSVVEHLRETAQKQAALNDQSRELLGQPEQQTPENLGPLQRQQGTLQETAQAIAAALKQQANQSDTVPSDPDDPNAQSPDQAAQASINNEKLLQASELVQAGSVTMKSASELLSPEDEQSRKLSEASQQQQIALEKLLEALALLDDPPPPDQNQNQDSSQQPQPQEQEQPQDSQQQNMNAEQMLQAIREREANRRQEKKPSNAMSTGSVEKDW